MPSYEVPAYSINSVRRALFIQHAYRVATAISLLSLFYANDWAKVYRNTLDSGLFIWATLTYLSCSVLLALFLPLGRKLPYLSIVLFGGCLDVISILTIMYASGGAFSGIGLLIIIAVMGVSVLVPGRMALLLCALASLGILLEQFLSGLKAPYGGYHFTQAGLLGGTTFLVAWATNQLASRIRLSEARLFAQAQEMRKQEHLAGLGRLAAGIAHEIRNPLGAINHAAEVLYEEVLTPHEKRFAEIILNHSKRINALIESVLDLSRPVTVLKENIPLPLWLQHFALQLKEALPNLDFAYTIDAQITHVSFVPTHLTQILTNLCENAARYSLKKIQAPWVRLNAKHEKSTVILSVLDQGPGISETVGHNIFEPFFSTESTGSGLGLFIARELAARNDAFLRYCNLPQGGCEFILEIPYD